MPKKTTIFLIIFVVFLLAIGATVYFIVKSGQEKISETPTEEAGIKPLSPETIKRLTVPEGTEIQPLGQETRQRLTAPDNAEIESLDLETIKHLTVPEQK